ncbi:Arc family DNA-binding protein [Acinetobacter sp. ANC 5383]
MAKDYSQVNFRMPTDLKEKLEEASKVNECSLTSEVVHRLESSFKIDGLQPIYLPENNLKQLTSFFNLSLMTLIQNLLRNGVTKEQIAASLPDEVTFKEMIALSENLNSIKSD